LTEGYPSVRGRFRQLKYPGKGLFIPLNTGTEQIRFHVDTASRPSLGGRLTAASGLHVAGTEPNFPEAGRRDALATQ